MKTPDQISLVIDSLETSVNQLKRLKNQLSSSELILSAESEVSSAEYSSPEYSSAETSAEYSSSESSSEPPWETSAEQPPKLLVPTLNFERFGAKRAQIGHLSIF